MVLGNLGSGLKDAFKRIAGLGVVDREAVESIVRELQRVLLASDVDVQLVSGLSDSIRKRVLGGSPPSGMTLKEYFIKMLYGELVGLLGAEKGEIGLEKQKILVVGLFGSGKCVSPDSLIPLSDGGVMEAEELYRKYEHGFPVESVEDGSRIDIRSAGLMVPSFNPHTLRIENKQATHLWKLEGKRLLRVFLDNGNDFSVAVTPEHPFFVLRNGMVCQIPAAELAESDFVAVPHRCDIEGRDVDILPALRRLDLEVYVGPDAARMLTSGQMLKNIHGKLIFRRNYCKFTTNIKNGRVPISMLENITDPAIKAKVKCAEMPVNIPRYLTSELAEFLGYVAGDGHVEKKYVEVVNEDDEIIQRLRHLGRSLFGMEPIVKRDKRDKRTKRMYRVIFASTTIVSMLSIFGLKPGKKGKKLSIPEQVLGSRSDVLRAFIRAYFDCDASAETGTRGVEVTSESRIILVQVAAALTRFGIASSISKKLINGVPYWRLSIRARHAETYAKVIGFVVRHKAERAAKFGTIGMVQGCGKTDMLPLGRLLKNVRESLGFSIGEIQEVCSSYGRYEGAGFISRESLAKVLGLYAMQSKGTHACALGLISEGKGLRSEFSRPVANSLYAHYCNTGIASVRDGEYMLTESGKTYLQGLDTCNSLLPHLASIASSDVSWHGVSKIEAVEAPQHVYDLTVEDNHSFVADGIIVHNTTTIGKLAKWFKVRGMGVGLVACDTHRAAAQEQLRQIASRVDVHIYNEGKSPQDIARNALKASKDDVLIFDTAGRDALDKELAKELKELGSIVKPDEVLLVIPADLGQAARRQSEEFNKLVGITGIIITKLDGTARGGGALAAAHVSGARVKFIGVGEKVDDFESYDPRRFVSRLIGYGDIEGLLEKAKQAGVEVDEDKAKRLMDGKFTMDDFYEQLGQMGKMGSLSKVMEMIPGMGSVKIPKDMMDVQEERMKKWKFIIESMTRQERENPDEIKASRITRIAKGSGTAEADVRALLKSYKQAQKFMKMAKGGRGLKRGPLAGLAKQFGMG